MCRFETFRKYIHTIYTSYTAYNRKRGESLKATKKRIRLKQFRIGLQLTQQEIADKLEISASHYIAIENGKRDGSQKFWATLQEVFHISDSDMYSLIKKGGDSLETADQV